MGDKNCLYACIGQAIEHNMLSKEKDRPGFRVVHQANGWIQDEHFSDGVYAGIKFALTNVGAKAIVQNDRIVQDNFEAEAHQPLQVLMVKGRCWHTGEPGSA